MLDKCILVEQFHELVAGDEVVVFAVLFTWARSTRRVWLREKH